MNILVDGRTMGSSPSGIGMYIYNYVKELNKDNDMQFVIATDVCESLEIKEFEQQNMKIIKYGKKTSKNFGIFLYYRFLQKCINEVKPDIFWAPNTLLPINLKNPYGKVMITIHDVFPITMPEHYGFVYPFYFRYGLRKAIHLSDILLYNSLETKKDTEKYFANAAKQTNFISYIIINRLEPAVTKDKGYFLYLGNLEQRKGTDLLIKAYVRYREAGGDRKLYLAGKVREEKIQNLLDRAQREVEGIHYLGYVEEERKLALYSECSCFVFPSRAEGFGIPPVEVMNFGKPIITSNLSIFDEILEKSVNYFDIHCEEAGQVSNLYDSLLQYTLPSPDEYKRIVNKYDAPGCTAKLKGFLTS